jgi:hypothetical protein
MEPFDAFEYDPMYKKNTKSFIDSLYSVELLIEENQLDEAISQLKNMISGSNSLWEKEAAIKQLYSVYFAGNMDLNEYINYLSNLNLDSYTTTEFINKSKVTLGDYDQPIQWLTNRVNNPESVMDSVYACIDLSLINLYNSKNDSNDISIELVRNWEIEKNRLLDILDGTNNYITETQLSVPFIYNIRNYPNPFNPITRITYNLKEDSKIVIKIYNIKGQLVDTIYNGIGKKGNNNIVWNISSKQNISSGVYFYKITSKNYEIIKKLIILK